MGTFRCSLLLVAGAAMATEGDVLGAKSKITHVFVGGRLVAVRP